MTVFKWATKVVGHNFAYGKRLLSNLKQKYYVNAMVCTYNYETIQNNDNYHVDYVEQQAVDKRTKIKDSLISWITEIKWGIEMLPLLVKLECDLNIC